MSLVTRISSRPEEQGESESFLAEHLPPPLSQLYVIIDSGVPCQEKNE